MPRNLNKYTLKAVEYLNEAKCTNISKLAKVLNVSWAYSRMILRLLSGGKLITTVTIGRRILWCINDNAAAIEIATLKRTLWHVICSAHRRFITPATAMKLIAKDQNARKIYAKYVNMDHINGNSLQFIASVLEDLIGPPIDRTARKLRFYVPTKICENEPRLDNVPIRRYKQPHRLVTFKVSHTMYMDLIEAANYMGTNIPHLVRMAIARLLSQYRHLIQ
jgi:DNA-binding IscR family transcriptional regulator